MFKYSSRFWLYAPTGAFLALAAAAMVHWWMLAGAFEKKLAALKGNQAIPGVFLDWDKVEVGGFPFRLDADFINFRIHGIAKSPFFWRTEKFALHTLAYNRNKTVYEAAGRQEARWAEVSGRARAVSFLPGSMHASTIVNRAGFQRFDLDVVDLGGKDFTLNRFQFHARRDPDGRRLDIMLKGDTLRAPGSPPRNLQIYANLNRLNSLASLLRGESTLAKAVQDCQATFSQVSLPPGQKPELLLSPLFFCGPPVFY